MLFHCRIFITRKKKKITGYLRDTRDRKWRENRGTEWVHIACGGHYFWCAPRLGELENIILSGWFDSAMKNVRSGDDKSWCWGEETGRQGVSFVMSAIWLHPLSPHLFPICLLSHISPFLVCLNFLLFYLSCVVCLSLLFFYLDTISHLFFTTLWCIILLHTLAAMLLFQLYPIFNNFWLSAHEEKGWVYLNHLFCASCLNVISPSLLPLIPLLPPPAPPHRQASFWQTMRIWLALGAKCTHKIQGTEMKNVNALKRNTHMHTHVKMSSPLTFLQFYLVRSPFRIFREMTVMQVAALSSLSTILFLVFGALDWTLTASKIESLPRCPHLTLSYRILLFWPCSPPVVPASIPQSPPTSIASRWWKTDRGREGQTQREKGAAYTHEWMCVDLCPCASTCICVYSCVHFLHVMQDSKECDGWE